MATGSEDPIVQFTTLYDSPSDHLPDPPNDRAKASRANPQRNQASGSHSASANQDTDHTPDRLEDEGGTDVAFAAADDPTVDDSTFDTTTTESSTGGPAVGHRIPGGASAAGKRLAEAIDSPDIKRPKIADRSSLGGLDLEIIRVKANPNIQEIECCATFFSGILHQRVTPEEVFKWYQSYRENQVPEPTDTGSPDGLLLRIIRIKPNPTCTDMENWATFITRWSDQLFTSYHVFQRCCEYRSGQDPIAGEGGPEPEDRTISSNGRDSGYGTRPPPPSGFENQDATQRRGPERPIPTPTNTSFRLPVICPRPGCNVHVKNLSGWVSHKTVHWPTKYGCLFCYEQKQACKLCGLSFQFLDYRLVAQHVMICVQNDEEEVNNIAPRSKRGWWQDREKLKSHLAEKHPDKPSEWFSDELLETWKVEIPWSDTTCINCNKSFTSGQELDKHYQDKHFGTRSALHRCKENIRDGNDDDTNNNDDDNDAGGGPSNQNQHSSQQNGKPGGSARNTHQSPTAGTSTAAGQQRSADMQETRGGRYDVHMRDIIPSHEPSAGYGSLSLPDQHPTLDLNPTLQSGTFLLGLGSQFMGQSKWRPCTEGVENQEWVDESCSTTKPPSKVVNLCQLLGKGSTAIVDSVWYPKNDEELARKSIRLSEDAFDASDHSLVAQVRREIKTLTILRHRHIINLVDWYETPHSMELLMSPVAKDNLMGFFNAAEQPGQHVTEPVARKASIIDQVVRWMSCLSSALVYMHSKGVTHGDIKPHNVLIRGRQAWLGDFGTAEFETEYPTGPGSTPRWLTPVYSAPEAEAKGPRGRSADIWSFGCVLLEVCTWLAGYQIQSLRDFRGSAKLQPYHVNFDSTLSWMRKLHRSFKLQEELRVREYMLDAALAMLVSKPDARITGLKAWEQLANGICKEGGCPCDNESPQVVDERLQEDLQPRPSGTLQTPEETEIDVIDAMKECQDSSENSRQELSWEFCDDRKIVAEGHGEVAREHNEIYAPNDIPPWTDVLESRPPPNLVPNPNQSYRRIKNRKDDCNSNHVNRLTRPVNFMPSRVLHISGTAEEPMIRLSDDHPTVPYAAISYCWGAGQPARTTRTSLSSYLSNIPFSTLPSTTRNAARVTRRLGLSHLWVDAFCIIQDDIDDIMTQIAQMDAIYRFARVTIAAMETPTCNDGFLQPRGLFQPIRMKPRSGEDGTSKALLVSKDDYYREGNPLFQRGWTMQETLLCTGLLVYGQKELVSLCLEGERCEGGHSFHVRNLQMSYDLGPAKYLKKDHPQSWGYLVSRYSQRLLAIEGDKLVEIAALAQEYGRIKTVSGYVAGMWRENFLEQCLWTTEMDRGAQIGVGARHTTTYRAPSWSWASLDGHILCFGDSDGLPLDPMPEKMPPIVTCQLVDVQTTLAAASNPFGMVTGGYLVIRGRLRQVLCYLDSHLSLYGTCHLVKDAEDVQGFWQDVVPDYRMLVNMDCWQEWNGKGNVLLWSIEICKTDTGRGYAILLQEAGQHNGLFKRVGRLDILVGEGDEPGNWFESDCDFREITII